MYGWEPFPTIYFTHSHWLITWSFFIQCPLDAKFHRPSSLSHPQLDVIHNAGTLSSIIYIFNSNACVFPTYGPKLWTYVIEYVYIFLTIFIVFYCVPYQILGLGSSKTPSSSSKWCGHWMCINIACLNESFTILYNLVIAKDKTS
jgi:hypothetical protein